MHQTRTQRNVPCNPRTPTYALDRSDKNVSVLYRFGSDWCARSAHTENVRALIFVSAGRRRTMIPQHGLQYNKVGLIIDCEKEREVKALRRTTK